MSLIAPETVFKGVLPITEDQACALLELYQANAVELMIVEQNALGHLTVEYGMRGVRKTTRSKINNEGDVLSVPQEVVDA